MGQEVSCGDTNCHPCDDQVAESLRFETAARVHHQDAVVLTSPMKLRKGCLIDKENSCPNSERHVHTASLDKFSRIHHQAQSNGTLQKSPSVNQHVVLTMHTKGQHRGEFSLGNTVLDRKHEVRERSMEQALYQPDETHQEKALQHHFAEEKCLAEEEETIVVEEWKLHEISSRLVFADETVLARSSQAQGHCETPCVPSNHTCLEVATTTYMKLPVNRDFSNDSAVASQILNEKVHELTKPVSGCLTVPQNNWFLAAVEGEGL